MDSSSTSQRNKTWRKKQKKKRKTWRWSNLIPTPQHQATWDVWSIRCAMWIMEGRRPRGTSAGGAKSSSSSRSSCSPVWGTGIRTSQPNMCSASGCCRLLNSPPALLFEAIFHVHAVNQRNLLHMTL
jgi:hypothetical protein